MRILVPLLLCVFVLREVHATKNELDTKKHRNLEILLPKRKAEQSRKDSFELKASPSVLQTVKTPQPEKSVAPQAAQNSINAEKKPELVPVSYEFSYGTPSHSHIQNKHPNGIIKGRYVIHAPNGQHRTVEYVADKGGFRAGVATNEPGTESASGGGSTIVSTAVAHPGNHIEAPHLAPLRVVDIQPFPAPLMRYEVAPGPPPVHLLPPPNSVEQLPHQILTQQVPVAPVVQGGIPQPVGLAPPPQFHHGPPVPPQQILIDRGHVPLLSPPDFHVIEQSEVPNDGTQQNQILSDAPVPNGNSVRQTLNFPSLEFINQGPRINIQSPQHIPAQGPPVVHAPQFLAPQPAIQVAPRPVVHPPPISHAPPPPPQQVLVAPPPPPAHILGPPVAQFDPLVVDTPRDIMMENERAKAHVGQARPTGQSLAIAVPPAGDFSRSTGIERAPLIQTVVQSDKSMRLPTIQPTHDSQIFEVKTKVVDHGGVAFNNNPRQLTRNLPFDGPILAAIKVSDFSAPRERIRNPEAIFKNLPPPSRRPPPNSSSKQPEPLIFLAVPPSAQVQKPSNQQKAPAPDLSKLFDAMPGPTVHDFAMQKFFDNIKEHHQNEVKFVKKHEHEFQALASRVMPFLMSERVSPGPIMHPHNRM